MALEQSEPARIEPNREQNLARLRDETFDVAVIGGGINGAAVARDAAMRGLKVALFDKGDFAGATSSRSSKLIHGGLRYLPQGQLRLVYEAVRERERLRHFTAPHLVHPIRFLLPFYHGRHPGRTAVSMALVFYDLFARTAPEERHRRLSAEATFAMEPALKAEGLKGGAVYYDGWGDDARITLENVLDAAYHGAAVANYVGLEGFSRNGSQIRAANVGDLLGRGFLEIRATRFVNAAGPWVDEIRRLDDRGCAPSVRLTKGAHLVIEASRLPTRNSLVLTDRGRVVFLMGHGDYVLVGTTDTDFEGDCDQVSANLADTAYLFDVIKESLPGIQLSESDVAYSFAGLRALVTSIGARRPSMVPREEMILESRSGLITIAGGKLTTHREIAERVVDRLMKLLGRRAGKSPTLTTPLPGARGLGSCVAELEGVPPRMKNILGLRYGTRTALIDRIVRERPELAGLLAPDAPAIAAEVVHAVRNECTCHLSDFMVGRTSMVWRAPRAASNSAVAVAGLMGSELGWDRAREQDELDTFFSQKALRAVDGSLCRRQVVSSRNPT